MSFLYEWLVSFPPYNEFVSNPRYAWWGVIGVCAGMAIEFIMRGNSGTVVRNDEWVKLSAVIFVRFIVATIGMTSTIAWSPNNNSVAFVSGFLSYLGSLGVVHLTVGIGYWAKLMKELGIAARDRRRDETRRETAQDNTQSDAQKVGRGKFTDGSSVTVSSDKLGWRELAGL